MMLASMSVAEAETYIEEGKKLLDRGKEVTAVEWLARRNSTIVASLVKANPTAVDGKPARSDWTEEKLKYEFDMPTLDALYIAILKFSGLQPGEVTAATASTPSGAA